MSSTLTDSSDEERDRFRHRFGYPYGNRWKRDSYHWWSSGRNGMYSWVMNVGVRTTYSVNRCRRSLASRWEIIGLP